MKCAEIKKLFSPYLDGRVSGAEMRSLTSHVEQCAACAGEYAAAQRTQQLLASLGRKKEGIRKRKQRYKSKVKIINRLHYV